MELRAENINGTCPTAEIASYVDGELNAARELELELHFAGCAACTEELNLQKHFLCTLNSSFSDEHSIDLPTDFTRRIVANAESSVSGLRKPNERMNAVLVCVGLLLIALVAVAAGSNGGVGETIEKITVVLGFVGHVAYSFVVGVGVVLRTLFGPLQMPAVVAFLLIAGSLYLLFRFSRVFLPFRRT